MKMPTFLDPKSLQATDATRRRMVRAFDFLLCARLGETIELNYFEHFTEGEYEHLNSRVDALLNKAALIRRTK